MNAIAVVILAFIPCFVLFLGAGAAGREEGYQPRNNIALKASAAAAAGSGEAGSPAVSAGR